MERDLAVLELQQALRAVLAASGYPAALYPDGFFGPETGRAVRLFQRLYSLPETGEVDQALWEAVIAASRQVNRGQEVSRLPVFPNAGFVMQPGSTGDLVS
ncbi:MAG TPA: peptidoglycan-binding protein, partial [Candidatus Faecivivens stercoravium]|nr:peptidoglycan-binding protein [Candidatus Faecivivens stercoravium]